jgi:hypothetical protein
VPITQEKSRISKNEETIKNWAVNGTGFLAVYQQTAHKAQWLHYSSAQRFLIFIIYLTIFHFHINCNCSRSLSRFPLKMSYFSTQEAILASPWKSKPIETRKFNLES